jgi:hypothetical protein
MVLFGGGYKGKVAQTRRAYYGSIEGNEYQVIIFKAHGKIAGNIARYGYTRHDRETLRQFFRMLQAALPVDKKAMWDFCTIVEQARYSDRAMGEPDRDKAIQAIRAIQYSLEKVILTADQLRMIQDGRVEAPDPARVASEPAQDLWVISPHPGKWIVPGKERKYTFAVLPRDKNKDALLKAFGAKALGIGCPLPPGEVSDLQRLLETGDFDHLGSRLIELGGNQGWRVFVSPSLASFLLEFQQRAQEAAFLRKSPSMADLVVVLKAAQMLSMAEGRDYMVPDDVKIAIMSAGPLACHMDGKDARFLLDEEIREIEAPRGFLAPEPVHMQGLPVPFV